MATKTMSSWVSQQLLVMCGTQKRIVTVFTKPGDVMSVRRSEFSFPSSNLSTDAQKHVDKDANRLDQDYIDEICIDYIQDGESYEEEYNCDDCDSIPSGVTIRISKI